MDCGGAWRRDQCSQPAWAGEHIYGAATCCAACRRAPNRDVCPYPWRATSPGSVSGGYAYLEEQGGENRESDKSSRRRWTESPGATDEDHLTSSRRAGCRESKGHTRERR